MCSRNVNELLLQAVEEINEEKTWRCIQSGADVNYRDPTRDQLPALFVIASRPRCAASDEEEAQLRARIAVMLIEAGAQVNEYISIEIDYLADHLPVLQVAVYFRNESVVNVLLNYGADVNAISRYKGFTALHYAVDDDLCDTKIVETLLKVQGIRVNIGCRRRGSQRGSTPLHLAVMKENSEELVELLLKHGADAGKENRRGMSAMQEYLDNALSLRTRNWRFGGIESSLLKLLPPSEFDTSPLHVACMFHRTTEVRKLAMADRGAINARDRFGHTPLFYAVMSRGPSAEDKSSTVKLLLNLGADIGQKFGRYHPADVDQEEGSYNILDVAILLGERDISVVLLQHLAKLVALQSEDADHQEKKLTSEVNLDLIYWRDEEQRISELWRYWADCHEELRAMKSSKVGESPICFFELLTADLKKSAVYAKRKKLVDDFEIGMCDVFPIYRDWIMFTDFGKAVEHRKLSEHAAEVMSDYLRFADPTDIFFERTLSYLDVDELKLVLDSMS